MLEGPEPHIFHPYPYPPRTAFIQACAAAPGVTMTTKKKKSQVARNPEQLQVMEGGNGPGVEAPQSKRNIGRLVEKRRPPEPYQELDSKPTHSLPSRQPTSCTACHTPATSSHRHNGPNSQRCLRL